MRDGEDEPPPWAQSTRHRAQASIQVRYARKAQVADHAVEVGVLCLSRVLDIPERVRLPKWLIPLVPAGDVEQTTGDIHTSRLRSACCQEPGNNALSAGEVADALSLQIPDETHQRRDYEAVIEEVGPGTDHLVVPVGYLIVVRSAPRSP